jgi:cyanophycinase
MPDDARGILCLSGATQWSEGAEVDAELVRAAGGTVVIVPTGAAYERPERIVAEARSHFSALGATVEAAMVLTRTDAESRDLADRVRAATFLYLCGGSPLHVRSVLKDSLVLDALVAAWHDGAVVAGQGGGSVVLSDPMVDPRGGAFTVGLGLVRNVAAIASSAHSDDSGLRRTISLLPAECALVGLAPSGAIVRSPEGVWTAYGEPAVYFDRSVSGLEVLAGKPVW